MQRPPLTAEEKRRIFELYRRGFNGYQIARYLGRGKTTIYKYLPKKGRPWHRWTDEDMQTLVDGYANGLPTAQIAAKIGCSPNAVRIAMTRHRKRVRADPRRRLVLYWLKVGFDMGLKPGQVLTRLRQADIMARLEG